MFEVQKVSKEIGGRVLSIETGKIARQADGSVIVKYGDTYVLVTVVAAPLSDEKEFDFFPLSVDYREKHSAAGKFPGGFIKREGRPSTKEVLTSRMIDRHIRPLFPDGYRQEVQVIASVLSFDGENDPDVLVMIGASAALSISKIPFMGPVGACRIGRVDGNFVINPTVSQIEKGDLNVLIGGVKEAINMLEVSAKEVSENVVADAVSQGHKVVAEVCGLIDEFRSKAGVEKEAAVTETDENLYQKIREQVSSELYHRKSIKDKKERNLAVKELLDGVVTQYCEPTEQAPAQYEKGLVKRTLLRIEEEIVRKMLLEGKRPDGRAYDELRQITCEVGFLPRTHGSGLFTRGETQAIVTVTLGTIRDAQIVDGLLEEYSQTFTLHYNFPPYAVGEVKPMRGPGRREIGHGSLAEKALEAIRPNEEDFAYTIRLVSDITESNGSSSMASICGGTLALMDAGVPIKRPVAGISIGMVSDGNGRYELLTDIIGEEDHFGDMDFKIAGTTEGITAIQLDIKARGLTHNIMIEAMERAKKTRLEILNLMMQTIEQPRKELSKYAPKLISIEIDPEFIGKVIGPGGKTIKGIQEQTGATIEIEEDGTIFISCFEGTGHLEAKEIIEGMTQPPQVGKLYPKAKVVSVKDFGAFVEIAPGVEGLCHVSELAESYVKNVADVCKVGDIIPVKLIAIDEQGRLKLSRKAAIAEINKAKKQDESKKQQ